MTDPQINRVMVAVGQHDMASTLSFAAREALLRGWGVHLVHGVPVAPDNAPAAMMRSLEATRREGQAVLGVAAATILGLVGEGVEVTTELMPGRSLVAQMAEQSEHAGLVVMQRHVSAGNAWLPTGSTTKGVAAKAAVPVVVVPSTWQPSEPPRGTVLVGVGQLDRAGDVVRAAADLARHHGLRLLVLHAWWRHESGGDKAVESKTRDAWTERVRETLRRGLETIQEDFSDLTIDIHVQHARPSEALLEATPDCDLLVLGRRDPSSAFAASLGSVARTALLEAPVPVLIVPPAGRRSSDTPQRGATPASRR